jgi:type I restriction enzyme M protein
MNSGNRFWSAGLTNPLVAVEQITYLLFLKRLEDIDRKRQQRGFPSIYAGKENCKWSYIRQEKTNPLASDRSGLSLVA